MEPACSAYFLSDFPLVPPLKNFKKSDFALVPPLKNFKKWPILVSLRNWPLRGIAGTFRAAVCGRLLSDDCTSSAYYLIEDGICARVFLEPASSGYFLSDFPLVPTLKNFKKWPILVSL